MPHLRQRRARWDDDDPYEKFDRTPVRYDLSDADALAADERWSSWDDVPAGDRGPQPRPPWLVTESAAIDVELGLLKTGKEADVHLLRRAVPGTDRGCLLAAKRYRSSEHRMFHRDVGYLEGRRTRRSRETRAIAARTAFGTRLIADRWASAEFAALARLWTAGLPVPYPVQVLGTELLLEFIGTDGEAAPRLVQLRPDPDLLADLWEQMVDAVVQLARLGYAHGDLSPYNVLVDDGRIVLIDLPQIVDVVTNPQGPAYLQRDVTNVASWFAARGVADADPDALFELVAEEFGR